MRAKVTTKAMNMKDGLGFKVSLVVTLQAKDKCWVNKLQLGN